MVFLLLNFVIFDTYFSYYAEVNTSLEWRMATPWLEEGFDVCVTW